jgi:hypothetical protein
MVSPAAVKVVGFANLTMLRLAESVLAVELRTTPLIGVVTDAVLSTVPSCAKISEPAVPPTRHVEM